MRSTISLPSALFTALYLACSTASANPLPVPSDFILAPVYTPPPPPPNAATGGSVVDSHIVSDSYLIVLKDDLEPHDIDRHHAHVESIHNADSKMRLLATSAAVNVVNGAGAGAATPSKYHGIKHKFHIGGKKKLREKSKVVKGYSGHFAPETLDAIRAMPDVKYVEKDSIVWATEVERGAPWGLARLSHKKTLSFGTFNRYEYDSEGGEGVDAYVIDTGINVDHVEFQGRAKWGKTVPQDPDQDLNGHGTHVAGTIGSGKYGVAKKANLIAVKVLGAGGSGTMSDVVYGVSWAADAAHDKAQLKAQGKAKNHKGSVANMSLGGGKSPSLDDAVDAAVQDGLFFAVAAGNDNKDSCAYSPAGSKEALTVMASTIGDERAYFSNFGRCSDVYAPGLNILSTWNAGPNSINTISGTSMASPHAAGLAAYFLSLYPEGGFNVDVDVEEEEEQVAQPQASFVGSAQAFFGFTFGRPSVHAVANKGGDKSLSPRALKKAMLKLSTKGIISDAGTGSPNLLLNNNYTSSAVVEALRASVVELADI